MKLKLHRALLLAGLMAVSAMAEESKTAAKPPEPPDKQKVSYALGMRMGLQLAHSGRPEMNTGTIARAVKDMLEGKPPQVQESEVPALMQQMKAYAQAKNAATNQADDITQAFKPAPKLPEQPDKEKFSYMMGMRLGQQLKRSNADVDVKAIAQGVQDVLEGKPTLIPESDIAVLFMQMQTYETAKQSEKNKAEGEAFLAKNAKAQGVTLLPSGLQYRVLQASDGAIPKIDDLLLVKYRGSFVNGKEFDHNDHFVTRANAGIKGWQEALQWMKVGSKWQIFIPSGLAYGQAGLPMRQVGPDATLIYELELISIVPPGAQVDREYGSGRLGHGLDQGAPPPHPGGSGQNVVTNAAPPVKAQ